MITTWSVTGNLPWLVDLWAAVCRMHEVAACASKELVAVNLIGDCNMFPWSMKPSFLEPQFYYLLREPASGPKANLTLMNVLTVVEAQRRMGFFSPDLSIWFPFFLWTSNRVQTDSSWSIISDNLRQKAWKITQYSPCVVTVNAQHLAQQEMAPISCANDINSVTTGIT